MKLKKRCIPADISGVNSNELRAMGCIGLSVLIALLALGAWHHFRGQRRLLEDVPTSKAAGITLGLTELAGTVACSEVAISPHGQTECAYWRQEWFVEDTDNNGRKTWRKDGTKEGGRRQIDLVDETGSVRVWIRDAQLDIPLVYSGEPYDTTMGPSADEGLRAFSLRSSTSTRRRKVKEYTLDIDADAYVIGTAFLPDNEALAQIGPDPDEIAPFIVSTRGEANVQRASSVAALIAAAVAIIAASAAAVAWVDGPALFDRTVSARDIQIGTAVAGAALMVWLMAVLGLVRAYNGLVRVKNRADKAWSLLRVETTRRHDLVPQLLATTKGYAAHEQQLHQQVTQLRFAFDGDIPEGPSDAAVADLDSRLQSETSAITRLLALAEAYPDLQADHGFRTLHDQLVVTEDRIALARHFYNESIERLKSRGETFPNSSIVWLFDLDLSGEFTETVSGKLRGSHKLLAGHPQ